MTEAARDGCRLPSTPAAEATRAAFAKLDSAGYVIETQAAQLLDAQQQTAAQYVILTAK